MNLIGDQMKPEDWAELRQTGHALITHIFQEVRALLLELAKDKKVSLVIEDKEKPCKPSCNT